MFIGYCNYANAKDIVQQDAPSTQKTVEIGLNYYKKSELDKALHYLNLGKEQATTQKDTASLIKALNGIGKVHSDKADNPTALSYYLKALSLAEKTKNEMAIAHIEKNIGVLYITWKNFDKALQHYETAQQIAVKLGDDKLIADCYNNKGTVYEQQKKYQKALEAYGKALAFYEKNKSMPGVAMSYSNLAIIYKELKNYQKAIDYNFKALDIMVIINDKWMQAATLNNIGNLYCSMKNYKQALYYGEKSVKLAQTINAKEIEVNSYEFLSEAAAAINNHQLAYHYMQKLYKVNQDFINTEKTHQFSELEVKYKTEKKEKELTAAKLKLSQEEIKSKQKSMWLVLLCSVVLLGIILFSNLRAKTKLKQEQLALENKLLGEQANAKVQEQRLEISRELHDSLGSQLTFISAVLDGLKKSTTHLDDMVNNKINTLSDFSENAINELKNTIWALNSKELYLNDLKLKILNFINNASEAKEDIQFNFDFDIAHNFRLNSKQAVNLFRVFQEIVNNTFKYAQAKNILASFTQQDNKLIMQIADDGIGFNLEEQQNKSYGISNIKKRIIELNGKLVLETAPNKGTRYKIEINLI